MAVYYVDKANGNDANAGTALGTAWQTLQKALRDAPAAAEVQIRGQTYTTPSLNTETIGKASERIFKPYAAETVIVDGLNLGVVSKLRLQGLQITDKLWLGNQNGSKRATEVMVKDCVLDMQFGGQTAAIAMGPSTDCTIEGGSLGNCKKDASKGGGNGITVSGNGNLPDSAAATLRLTIRGVGFHDIATDGISVGNSTTDLLIEDNVFDAVTDGTANGTGTAHNDLTQLLRASLNFKFQRNFATNGKRGILLQIQDGHTGAHTNPLFENNLIAPTSNDICLRLLSCVAPRIVNNTFWNDVTPSATGCLQLAPTTTVTNAVVKNNIARLFRYVTASTTFTFRGYNLIASGPVVGTDIQGAPTFVSLSADDYQLAAGSLGIDAAEPIPTDAPAVDLNGTGRPIGANRDMGAYESPAPGDDPEDPPDPPDDPPPPGATISDLVRLGGSPVDVSP